jgi:hypothetical protein
MTTGVTTHILVDGTVTTGSFFLSGSDVLSDRFNFLNDQYISSDSTHDFSFYNKKEGDFGLAVWGELQVGHPQHGTESVFGEGDSYTNGMLVLTSDGTATSTTEGGNITDVSADAASPSGSTFTFQGTTANHCLYFGSTLGDTSDKVKHWGLKLTQTTAAVEITKRSFVIEYWDGAAWTETKVMATDSSDYARYANEVFIRANNSEHLRFGLDLNTTWIKKTIGGQNLYWTRIRVTNNLISAPVFEQAKISPSRFEANQDGTNSYHGNARFVQSRVVSGGPFGQSGSVASNDFPIGTGAFPASWDHELPSSTLNMSSAAIYYQAGLLPGIDTSRPVFIDLTYLLEGGAGTNDADLICSFLPVEVQGVLEADPSGGLTPVARTLANTEVMTANAAQTDSTSGLNVNTSADVKLRSIQFGPFDVSSYYEGDMVFLRLELDDDGADNVNLSVMDIGIKGSKWTHGTRG